MVEIPAPSAVDPTAGPSAPAVIGVVGGGQLAWMLAVAMIPLVEVFALEFTAPLWVAVLAPLFLRERLTLG